MPCLPGNRGTDPLSRQTITAVFVIYDDGFNYLTKMCLTNMREAAFRMIKLAKERGCTVIVSSSDSTDRFELYPRRRRRFHPAGRSRTKPAGTGECLPGKKINFFHIDGLAFKQNGAVVKTKRRGGDERPGFASFPAWDLVNINAYRDMWLKHAGYFSLNMGTTPGMPV